MPLRSEPSTERELRCPRDGSAMAKTLVGEVTYDRCVECQGIWFDAGELRRVAEDRAVESLATRRVPVLTPSAFGCPRCWGDCHEVRIGRVTLDSCSSCHGVWLDAGELAAAREEADALRGALAALEPWQRLVLLVK